MRRTPRHHSTFASLRRLAKHLAEFDRLQAQQREQRERAIRFRWLRVEYAYREHHSVLQDAIRNQLIAAGFRQHARGQWRLQRIRGSDTMVPSPGSEGSQNVAANLYQPELATIAETAVIDLISGGDCAREKQLRVELANLQQRYGRESDSPLEKAIVRDVALSQMLLAFCDASYANCQGMSLSQARFLLNRQRRAHHRFMQAVKSLTTVRHLMARRKLRVARS